MLKKGKGRISDFIRFIESDGMPRPVEDEVRKEQNKIIFSYPTCMWFTLTRCRVPWIYAPARFNMCVE
jgi:hypothetical protein